MMILHPAHLSIHEKSQSICFDCPRLISFHNRFHEIRKIAFSHNYRGNNIPYILFCAEFFPLKWKSLRIPQIDILIDARKLFDEVCFLVCYDLIQRPWKENLCQDKSASGLNLSKSKPLDMIKVRCVQQIISFCSVLGQFQPLPMSIWYSMCWKY